MKSQVMYNPIVNILLCGRFSSCINKERDKYLRKNSIDKSMCKQGYDNTG